MRRQLQTEPKREFGFQPSVVKEVGDHEWSLDGSIE
jgi:hypothetical protein